MSRNRRAACALSSAAVISALCGLNSAKGAVNSFFPGISFAGADFTDPTNWTLGHVPNDPTEQIVLPPGGQVNGAVTMTFNGGNIVAATLTQSSSAGRILTNTTATPANLTLAGIAGQPTILDTTPGLQLSLGNGSNGGNNITLTLGSVDNEFRNMSANAIKIFANIAETQPGTNVTLTFPNGNLGTGTPAFVLGGSNSFTGALNIHAPSVTFDYSVGTAQLIDPSGSLNFDGGTVNITGSQNGTSQSVAMTTFNAGSTQFLFNSNGANGTSVFNLGNVTRNPGAVANVVTLGGATPLIKTITSNNNGIIGGWLLTNGTVTSSSVYNWATADVNGNLVPFTAYNTKNDLTTWSAEDNINIDNAASVTGSVGDLEINSLRTSLSTAGSITINTTGLLTITTGGILPQGTAVTSLSFSGSGKLTSGTTDLMITMPSGTGAKTVAINIPIVDRTDEGGIHPVGITKSMGGTLIIAGSQSFSGPVFINNGSISVDTIADAGQPSGLGLNDTIHIGSEGDVGTLNISGTGSMGMNRNIVFGTSIPSGANPVVGGAIRDVGTLVLSGNLTGGSFTKFGIGGWTSIIGSQTYSGQVEIGAGTLDVNVIAPIGSPSGLGTGANGSTITLGNANAGCLNYSGLVDATTNRPIAVNSAGQIIRVENNATPVNLSLTGALTGSLDLTKNGSGTLIISGSKSYSGSLTIGKGDLSIDNAGGVGNGTATNASTITIGNSNTATLTFTGTSGTISRPLIIKPQVGVTPTQFGGIETTAGTLTLTGGIETNSRALAFDGAGTTNVSSAIVGAGSITKNGSGTLILNTGNNYTKGTFINAGTVVVFDDTSLGNTSGNLSIGGGAVLLNAGNLTSGRAVTLTAGGGVVNTNGFSASFSGAVTGSGNLTKMGAGVLNLTGSNSYTGNTNVQGGTLTLTGANAWAPALNGPGFTNITAGRVVLEYTGGTSPAPAVQSLLTTSFASGFATGQLRSTTADAHHGLGWSDDGSRVSVAYTYFGDANLDGAVDTSDFTALGLHFGSTTGTWQTGDFNYDGKVNALDFNAIATNFGSTPILPAPALGSVVPEPAGLLLALGGLLPLKRRRRR